MEDQAPRTCPHCGSPLKRWRVPREATWTEPYFFVCFDDTCPFYVGGWAHMQEKYGQKASFRFMINPRTGTSSPASRMVPWPGGRGRSSAAARICRSG